ncbi:uroporphyrinogen-III synthase [Hyphomicrobium sp. CS1GBMeth3]|uniref:uroporphyrinogen-III synthase n=1 Tax=Hyphomicrobium sp. CS1GBMeth3 TaxID=1892845 RepID=UPI001558CB25|nr:uroporphyrinogen-III synthase [Hyphomicrobium sp. CS1GBMeth3]
MTRPESGPEPDPLRDALRAAGHRIMQAPLLSVTLTGTMPSLEGAQALIATSRNGLRAVAPVPGAALELPIFAVGPGTAALARRLGFRRVIEGPGTGAELAEVIRTEADPVAGALIHLAGDTLAFDLKSALAPLGFEVRTETVYRTETAPALPTEVADTLRRDELDAVLLMSPRTARVYAELVADPSLAAAARRLRHFCLSEAVAGELTPLGPVSVTVARLPNSQEMLALIAREAPDSP